MAYLLGFDANNTHRLGTSYKHKVVFKNIKLSANRAKAMQKFDSTIQTVYLITDKQYTQKVCELSEVEFTKHIKSIGIKLL